MKSKMIQKKKECRKFKKKKDLINEINNLQKKKKHYKNLCKGLKQQNLDLKQFEESEKLLQVQTKKLIDKDDQIIELQARIQGQDLEIKQLKQQIKAFDNYFVQMKNYSNTQRQISIPSNETFQDLVNECDTYINDHQSQFDQSQEGRKPLIRHRKNKSSQSLKSRLNNIKVEIIDELSQKIDYNFQNQIQKMQNKIGNSQNQEQLITFSQENIQNEIQYLIQNQQNVKDKSDVLAKSRTQSDYVEKNQNKTISSGKPQIRPKNKDNYVSPYKQINSKSDQSNSGLLTSNKKNNNYVIGFDGQAKFVQDQHKSSTQLYQEMEIHDKIKKAEKNINIYNDDEMLLSDMEKVNKKSSEKKQEKSQFNRFGYKITNRQNIVKNQ